MTLPVANSIGSNTGGTKWRRLDQSSVIILYNATKSRLIVKEEHAACAAELFQGIDVQITTEGQRHLGAALGSHIFCGDICDRQGSGVGKRGGAIGGYWQ